MSPLKGHQCENGMTENSTNDLSNTLCTQTTKEIQNPDFVMQMILTALDHAPKPQVTDGTNAMNHEHKMIHLGKLTWNQFTQESYILPYSQNSEM